MNWIERMHELKGHDLYSQNGEGFYLEYVFDNINSTLNRGFLFMADIGSGDGFYLSNSRHLFHLGWHLKDFDKEFGYFITKENVNETLAEAKYDLISIDLDGNDYWILQEILKQYHPSVIVSEFNPAFIDSRAIKYNPDHVWDGTDYYGFSFEAAKKLASDHGYTIIFNLANMNLFMVRNDLIKGLHVPDVKYKQDNFFPHNDKGEWVMF